MMSICSLNSGIKIISNGIYFGVSGLAGKFYLLENPAVKNFNLSIDNEFCGMPEWAEQSITMDISLIATGMSIGDINSLPLDPNSDLTVRELLKLVNQKIVKRSSK